MLLFCNIDMQYAPEKNEKKEFRMQFALPLSGST